MKNLSLTIYRRFTAHPSLARELLYLKGMRLKTLWFSVVALVSPLAQGVNPTTMVQAMVTQQLVTSGKEAYLNRCAGCHGVNADGKGPAAPMLTPKPRNLVEGSFKFRTTASGILPTVEDLLRTIDRGVRVSSGYVMPPFREVAEQEKLALVAYIRSLRPEFASSLNEQVSIVSAVPPAETFASKASLLTAAGRGKLLYLQACLTCHGNEGRGDGPSAAELTDADNEKIAPANLRTPHLKSGPTSPDVFRAITTGLDGSPMPGFRDLYTDAQRWDLTAYLFYLRGVEAGVYAEGELK